MAERFAMGGCLRNGGKKGELGFERYLKINSQGHFAQCWVCEMGSQTLFGLSHSVRTSAGAWPLKNWFSQREQFFAKLAKNCRVYELLFEKPKMGSRQC